MPMSPRLLRPRQTGGDPDALLYIAAVQAADGQPLEAGVRKAISDFVVGCKADGIWSAIKASCLLMGARTLAGALTPLKYGAELWTAPTPAITALQGASGSWNAATTTMSSLTTGTSGTTPRFNFNLGLVAGVRYKVSGRLSGDTALVGSVRLGTSLLTYNSTTGEISGTIAAVDSTLAVYFNSTQGPASASIVSLSVMEDWTPTNNGPFVAGDYNRKTGLVGNASTKYLDANRAGTSDPLNSSHFCVYASTAESGNFGSYIGTNSAIANDNSSIVRANTSLSFTNRSVTALSVANAGTATGFIGCNRASSTAFEARVSGSTSSQSITSGARSSINFFIFGTNTGSLANAGNSRLAFYSIGEGLDLALLDARVTALINAIGAAIP